MSRSHWLLGVLAVAVLTSGWLFAEPQQPGKLKGTLPANWKKLGLSEEQVQKVYKIQADYDTKYNELQEKLKQLKQSEKSDLVKVLTETQKAKLREIIEDKLGAPPAKDKDKDN